MIRKFYYRLQHFRYKLLCEWYERRHDPFTARKMLMKAARFKDLLRGE